MPKNLHKYFWDGEQEISEAFRLRWILEYTSFPDLIAFPFASLKNNLSDLDIEWLRTSEKRKTFIRLIAPLLDRANSRGELFEQLLNLSREDVDEATKSS